MFQYDFFCAATTLVIFSWIALRRRDRRLRLRVLVAVLVALSLLSLCQASALLGDDTQRAINGVLDELPGQGTIFKKIF
jgi:hypothetical protein